MSRTTRAASEPADDPVCPPDTEFSRAVGAVRSGASAETEAGRLVGLLEEPELLGLLDGDLPLRKGMIGSAKRYNAVPYVAGQVRRLGIPGIRFTDGPRGVLLGSSTSFPVPVARAATWDPALETRIGEAIGKEARAQGANFFGGVCVNVAPSPGWGRSQESYGDEPVLVGAMGAGLVRGTRPWVISCVKHFALNSMEEARFVVDVRVDDATLHESYLPHFRQAIEAGADAVMTSYNAVDGQWAGQNRHLLQDVLRDELGFRGIVVTDFVWGLRDAVASVRAGQDVEMPFALQRARTLPKALADGELDRAEVLRSAERIVRVQLELAVRARSAPPATVVASPDHHALAREAAAQGTVLLRNTLVDDVPVLPLDPSVLGTVLVAGSRAAEANLGDVGSSQVRPPTVVSPLDGLRERLGGGVVVTPGATDPHDVAAVAAQAAQADAAVLVVGLDAHDEGEAMVALDDEAMMVFGGPFRSRRFARGVAHMAEKAMSRAPQGGDRRDLHLHPEDEELVRAVCAAQPRTVVVVIGGGTMMLDPWDRRAGAILVAWYPGMEGGRAIADVLVGDAEPGGRLPAPIPRTREDLPVLDWGTRGRLDYPRLFGQRLLDANGVEAAYPLGFGLGYARITVTGARLVGTGRVQVDVENTEERPGQTVVQVYATQHRDDRRPARVLAGFATVQVPARASANIEVESSLHPLDTWADGQWQLFDGPVALEVGLYAGDPDAVRIDVP